MRTKKIKSIVFTLLLICSKGGFSALDAPELRCIALDELGNATLTWSKPPDPNGEFTQYIIYYKDGSSGSFNPVRQINNYDSVSTLFIGNFAKIGSFYVVATSNGGIDVSPGSSIISPILIALSNVNRSVTLKWNSINLPSTDSIYRLYRSINGGLYELIAQLKIPTTEWVDVIQDCKADLKYYVEVTGIGGCESRSNFPTKTVVDKEPPRQTNLHWASVDTATGNVNLAWDPSRSVDGFGYIIYYFDAIIRTDTVFGAQNLNSVYTKNGINALLKPETLSIAPFDSCLDATTLWYNQAADSLRFATLFIDTFGYDRCDGKVGIKWNMPSDSIPVGVKNLSGFRVYRKTNNGASVKIATLSAADSLFVDSTLVKGEIYTYLVTAYDSKRNEEAFSNKFIFKVTAAKAPKQLFITHIQADSKSQNNLVYLLTDTTSETVKYGLQRALYDGDGFQDVAFSTVINDAEFFIEDESGRADQTDFYYQMVAYDYCDEVIKITPVAKSIYIDGFKQEADYVNFLNWSDYRGFDTLGSTVSNYYVIRLTNDTKEDTIYESLKNFETSDTIFDLTYIGGKVCYYVKAIESDGDRFGLTNTSISNQFCVVYNPLIYIPNAFTPDDDGINDVFLPDVNFVDVTEYSLIIFDRTGLVVFETKIPTEGWDGRHQEIDVYVYHLRLKNARGESAEFAGKVLLLR